MYFFRLLFCVNAWWEQMTARYKKQSQIGTPYALVLKIRFVFLVASVSKSKPTIGKVQIAVFGWQFQKHNRFTYFPYTYLKEHSCLSLQCLMPCSISFCISNHTLCISIIHVKMSPSQSF